jgi:hypothetical protein
MISEAPPAPQVSRDVGCNVKTLFVYVQAIRSYTYKPFSLAS